MTETWTSIGGWWLHSAAAGGFLLLLTWMLVRRTRQPGRQQHLGRWGLFAAAALAVLCLAPAWLLVPLPSVASPESQTAAVVPPLASPAPESASRPAPEGRRASSPRPSAGPAPAWVWLPSQASLPVLQPREEAAARPTIGEGDSRPTAAEEVPATKPLADTALIVEHSGSAFSAATIVRWLGAAYAVGALWFLVRWLLGHAAVGRLLWSCEPAPLATAQLLADATPTGPLPRLLVSRRLQVPLSCGLLRPTVVLPAWLCRPENRQALCWVYAHELTHLERRDAWTCLLFAAGQVLYYYLPWFWWLRREVRLCQEYFADAAATQAAPAEDYAQFLLRFTRTQPVPAGALGVLGTSSDLFRRITMLLDKPVSLETRCPRQWALATACGLLALAVLLSGLGMSSQAVALPTPDEKKKEEPKKEEPKKEDAKPAEPKKDDPPAFPPRKNLPLPAPEIQPPGVDVERYQKQQQEMMRQMRKAMEQGRRNLPPGAGGLFGVTDQSTARLGAEVSSPSDTLAQQLDLPKGQGIVIESVQDDSAAAKAGIKAHDILLELNGKPVRSDVEKLSDMIKDIKANVAVDAVVLRKGKREMIKGIKLPEEAKEAPGAFPPGFGGLKLQGPVVMPPPGAINPPPAGFGPAFPGAGFGGVGIAGGAGVTTSVFRTEDRFTTRHEEGSLIVTVTGKVADGKVTVNEIHVQDGIQTKKYEAVDKVPEQYRDKVKNLVEMSEKSSAKIELKKP